MIFDISFVLFILSIREVAKSVFCHIRHYNIQFLKKCFTDLVFQTMNSMDYSTMHLIFSTGKVFSDEYLSYCMPFVPRYANLICCKQVVFSTFCYHSCPIGFILLLHASLWSLLFYRIFLCLYLPNGKEYEQFSGLLIKVTGNTIALFTNRGENCFLSLSLCMIPL